MSERSPTPWTGRARAATAAGLVVGALLVLVGAFGASAEERVPDQIVWLDVAVGGVIVGGATVLLWLLAGRRAVTGARNRVVALYAGDLDTSVTVADPRVALGDRVTVAGSSWYHRPDCLLTLGKALVEVRPTDRLAPCQVCGG